MFSLNPLMPSLCKVMSIAILVISLLPMLPSPRRLQSTNLNLRPTINSSPSLLAPLFLKLETHTRVSKWLLKPKMKTKTLPPPKETTVTASNKANDPSEGDPTRSMIHRFTYIIYKKGKLVLILKAYSGTEQNFSSPLTLIQTNIS